MRRLHNDIFSMIALFIIGTSIYSPAALQASELRSSSGSENSTSVDAPGSVSFKKQCPTLLKEWVKDEFSDKSTLGLKSYPSEAKFCQDEVSEFQTKLKAGGESTTLESPSALRRELGARYNSKIHPSYQEALAQCDSLPKEQALAIQSRFYSAGSKLEAVSSGLIDEIAFVDSVLPNTRPLHGVPCPNIWPDLAKKCETYKKTAEECGNSRQGRVDELVKRTKQLLPEIEGYRIAYQACYNKYTKEPGAQVGHDLSKNAQENIKSVCGKIQDVLDSKVSQVPWVLGKDFQEIAIERKYLSKSLHFSTAYHSDDKVIEKAILKQLEKQRDGMVAGHQQNIEWFRCIADTSGRPANCDFKEIRKFVAKMPDLRNFDSPEFANASGKELRSQFRAEACLAERGQTRDNKKEAVELPLQIGGAILTTAGTGWLVAAGFGVVRSALAARWVVGAAIAAQGPNFYQLAEGGIDSTKACRNEKFEVIKIAKSIEAQQDKVCSVANKTLSAAIEKHSDCMSTSLLASTAVFPFLGTFSKGLKKFAGNSDYGRASPKLGDETLFPDSVFAHDANYRDPDVIEDVLPAVGRHAKEATAKSGKGETLASRTTAQEAKQELANPNVPSGKHLPALTGKYEDIKAKVTNVKRARRDALVFQAGSEEGKRALKNLEDGDYIFIGTDTGKMAVVPRIMRPKPGDDQTQNLGNHAVLERLLEEEEGKPVKIVTAGVTVVRGGKGRGISNEAGGYRGDEESLDHGHALWVASGLDLPKVFFDYSKNTYNVHTRARREVKWTLIFEKDPVYGPLFNEMKDVMSRVQKKWPDKATMEAQVQLYALRNMNIGRNEFDHAIFGNLAILAQHWYNPLEGPATTFQRTLKKMRTIKAPEAANMNDIERLRYMLNTFEKAAKDAK